VVGLGAFVGRRGSRLAQGLTSEKVTPPRRFAKLRSGPRSRRPEPNDKETARRVSLSSVASGCGMGRDRAGAARGELLPGFQSSPGRVLSCLAGQGRD
jgi:hypothetical protein